MQEEEWEFCEEHNIYYHSVSPSCPLCFISDSMKNNVDWMEIILPVVNPAMLNRPTKHSRNSLFRDYPHKTKNGKGLISGIK